MVALSVPVGSIFPINSVQNTIFIFGIFSYLTLFLSFIIIFLVWPLLRQLYLETLTKVEGKENGRKDGKKRALLKKERHSFHNSRPNQPELHVGWLFSHLCCLELQNIHRNIKSTLLLNRKYKSNKINGVKVRIIILNYLFE